MSACQLSDLLGEEARRRPDGFNTVNRDVEFGDGGSLFMLGQVVDVAVVTTVDVGLVEDHGLKVAPFVLAGVDVSNFVHGELVVVEAQTRTHRQLRRSFERNNQSRGIPQQVEALELVREEVSVVAASLLQLVFEHLQHRVVAFAQHLLEQRL